MFRVAPAEPHEVAERRYHPGPTPLPTTWRTDGSEVVAVNAMVSETRGAPLPATVLVHPVEVRGQPAPVEVLLDPVRCRAERPRCVTAGGGTRRHLGRPGHRRVQRRRGACRPRRAHPRRGRARPVTRNPSSPIERGKSA